MYFWKIWVGEEQKQYKKSIFDSLAENMDELKAQRGGYLTLIKMYITYTTCVTCVGVEGGELSPGFKLILVFVVIGIGWCYCCRCLFGF